MEATRISPRLIDRLPPVRGAYREHVSLARYAWFRVGGPAEVLFLPADEADLQHFLAHTPEDIPITTIGVASNLLIRDGGIPGVVVRLRGAFAEIAQRDGTVVAGAGALDINVARFAQRIARAGLEFLSGIPGTIGGALRMNAGAYGRELKDTVTTARACDRSGRIHTIGRDTIGFRYRGCAIPEDWIFLSAEMETKPDDPARITARMDEIAAMRTETQPVRSRTGGSTFKNPDGYGAWQLIERAGCRGLKSGSAQVSEKHCNFLINTGKATAAELEALGEEVRRRVRETSGIELEWEIKRIGNTASGGQR